MRRFCAEYAKHAALNLGQALHGLRHVASHPDIDRRVPRGTTRHLMLSLWVRGPRIANDLCFALLPPRTHHSREELAQLLGIPLSRWFQYGYCAWRFDDTGAPKCPLPPDVDRRWDPRCQEVS